MIFVPTKCNLLAITMTMIDRPNFMISNPEKSCPKPDVEFRNRLSYGH
jgi:hypothetical protein